ncbi:MAG: DUF4365 domain-containing protein [Caldilineaceae bacterium SB0665_bin_25]|nr:DUF4365 domain-containing protein [Caldilineaceae bacterium SB0665_bin_25]
MDLNAMKERFPLAYIGAVASQAGYYIVEPKVDQDSVDGTLMGDIGRRPRIDFQAKATAQDILRESHLAFPLPVKNYDDLRADTRTPRILIVVLMPGDSSQWLNQTHDELCLRNCGYWISLDGQPPRRNTSSVTIDIPATNIFSSEQLADLMRKAEGGTHYER